MCDRSHTREILLENVEHTVRAHYVMRDVIGATARANASSNGAYGVNFTGLT